MIKVQRALLSVSDKRGIIEFARSLQALGVTLLSTGGTAKLLADNNIPVTDVSDYTGSPEIMNGRVKTLHPKIHGGILSRREQDAKVMAEHDITPIDLVVVNLYPFAETIAKPGCTRNDAIENIDIGGPTMIRAAAKNQNYVTVCVDPADYDGLISELKAEAGISQETRERLATKAFEHTAAYDATISQYFAGQAGNNLPDTLNLSYQKISDLRYGENPHQQAAFYAERRPQPGSLANADLLQGKPLSYNNIADADAAFACVSAFAEPACVIVKHANPCGVASSTNLKTAYERAYATDPTSAFGGIVAFNRSLDGATAQQIIANQFVEVVIAPALSDEAVASFSAKPNVRLLATQDTIDFTTPAMMVKQVNGGILLQQQDKHLMSAREFQIVSQRQPTEAELGDLHFAWQVVQFVKSNAIVYAKDGQTIGVGAGQMSRIDSAKIAGSKAKMANLTLTGTVMASDAFFPFRDSIDEAARLGITAIIQPGGSRRDSEVIAAADEAGIAMVFTGIRHFLH